MDVISISFSIAYFAELLINMAAQGTKIYFMSTYNKFDCIIVLVSMIDVVYFFVVGELNVNSITALRMFRMMRVFKLAKVWRTFRKLLKTIWKTMLDIASFSIILVLFIYIYSILGMELFAGRAKFRPDDTVADLTSDEGASLD
jgi:Ion transport protein